MTLWKSRYGNRNQLLEASKSNDRLSVPENKKVLNINDHKEPTDIDSLIRKIVDDNWAQYDTDRSGILEK